VSATKRDFNLVNDILRAAHAPWVKVAYLPDAGPAGAYLATELVTATPHRLRELLYDGAIRLCRQAVAALDAGDVERSADRFARARCVVQHLQASLGAADATPASRRFADLYEQVHRRLLEADFYRKREAANQTILILNCQRPAWRALVAESAGTGPGGGDATGWIG